MKNQFKKTFRLLGVLFALLTISCENDSISETENQEHSHGKAPNEVSFDFFKKTTQIDDVDLFLKSKMNHSQEQLQNRSTGVSLSDFIIDTTYINKCVLNNKELSFSFRIYPISRSENKSEVYNLVISRVDNQWESSIFLLTKNESGLKGKMFSSIEKIYQSTGLPQDYLNRSSARFNENEIWHCPKPKGHCLGKGGACDLCSACFTIVIENTIPPLEEYDNLSLQSPFFTYNEGGGGGGSQNLPHLITNPEPCEGITQKINNPDINSKIVNFKTPAVLYLNYEKGFDFVENADRNLSYNPIDGNPGQTGITFTIDANGNTVGFIHSHFDKPNMSPVFTIEDVKSFNAIDIFRSTRGKTRTNTCLMLVSRAGVFALVIEDFTLMKNYGDKLHNPEDFEEQKDEYNGDTPAMLTDDDVIKQVLQILPKYGVGLYKANDNLDGWNKLTYNPNTNSITPTPCN